MRCSAPASESCKSGVGQRPARTCTLPEGWVCCWLQGWVDTTYLDEDTRIGRGDKGSVFVTTRKGVRANHESEA